MKKILYSILSLILIFGATSCENWLDVNTNPDTPSNQSASVEIRLPWIQHYYMYAYGSASVRTNAAAQIITNVSHGNHISRMATWDPWQDMNITPYQQWFVGAANNIPDLINKAEETGAYHYKAAALVLKSMGYIMMADLFGEIPYTEAIGESFAPKHDLGETVYEGCLADIETAIEIFSAPQENGATPLSAGDTWNGGDVNKWIKLCYGLKARWLGTLSKTDKYDTEAILAAISKAPQSNAENTKVTHYNVETSTTAPINGDAFGPNTIYNTAAWGTGQRLNKWYIDILTNLNGSGVEDPRANKLIPSAMCNVVLSDDGASIKTYEWRRDAGVNVQGMDEGWTVNRYAGSSIQATYKMATEDEKKAYSNSDILKYYTSVDAFVKNVKKLFNEATATVTVTSDSVKITYHPGALYAYTDNVTCVEDVKYVNYRADAVFQTYGLSKSDMNCYISNKTSNETRAMGFVQGTGAFYTRPDSDADILTYSEMCFLKAEVLFRKGDKSGAYNAYIEGIKSHFARMNEKLASWDGSGSSTTARGFDVSFAYAPMAQSEIDAYMASAAVKQSAAALTMSDIMTQKLIALGYNYQTWNDVRRFNYNAGNIADFGVVYKFETPMYRMFAQSEFDSNPQSDRHYVRRMMQSYLETDYNTVVTDQTVVELYGQYGIEGGMDPKIYSIPVWWDWTK